MSSVTVVGSRAAIVALSVGFTFEYMILHSVYMRWLMWKIKRINSSLK